VDAFAHGSRSCGSGGGCDGRINQFLAGLVAATSRNSNRLRRDLPDSLSWFTMATPSLLALAARGFTSSSLTRGIGRYTLLCLIVGLALAAVVIIWTHGMLPEGGEEW